MPYGAKLERKNAYMRKLVELVESSPQTLIVDIDHVGSLQMQKIRLALRKKCTVLMGKNTMIRTALRKRIEEDPASEATEGIAALLKAISGNMGFIFCQEGQMQLARDVIASHKVPAMARAGAVAPVDVKLPAGPSGLEPAQTSFFQALNIPTKIVKGMIEITSEVHLIKAGEKVSLSAQALLGKLGIKPFEYGMVIRSLYQDGAVCDAAVLDITDDVLIGKFLRGVGNVAAFGREIGVPTEAGLPHYMTNAFKNLVALVADVDFTFPEAQEIKDILSRRHKHISREDWISSYDTVLRCSLSTEICC
jgi:large subunit ribosomal protein LP0